METKAVPTGKDDLQVGEPVIAGTALWVWLGRADELASPPEGDGTHGGTTEEYRCTYDDPEQLTYLCAVLRMYKEHKYRA
ncbi:MAG: hypothetical protein MUP04_10810 [Anaerolineae bacterium]|nr:hypothetical protein [Anaerolineae bacterium]